MASPFGRGSVSYKPYVCSGRAADLLADFVEQVRRAETAGFDGVVASEHHLGFPGYLPNPFQAVGWALEETRTLWAAPCPALLLLRPLALQIEELAWLQARRPGRVGAGFAAGAIAADFELSGTDMHDLTSRFRDALQRVTTVLHGLSSDFLTGDSAVAALAENPIPVVSAASSSVACRRAGEVGCGVVLESHHGEAYVRRFVDAYRSAGGNGPCVLNRRVWVGEAPRELQAAQVALYKSTVPSYDRRGWLPPEQMILSGAPSDIAGQLNDILLHTGATAVTLRVHVNGVEPALVHEQVSAVGEQVLPALRMGAWFKSVAE
jgi:alkanesulfonate monooxygenase SsuD/methylene tetrahydromethanopterin reductase-like flavin-dependent oxidoreductase (luciferase family)